MRVWHRHRARRYALALALAFAALLCSAPAALAVTLTVDSLGDGEEGSCSPTSGCTLREAVNLVAEGEEEGEGIGGDVTIDFGVEGTIEIEEELELIFGEGVESLTIQGPGEEKLTIDGQDETRVFETLEGEVKISGLTVEKGHVSGLAIDGDGGAALFVDGGDVTLEDVRFTDNHIEGERAGGAIDVEGGDLTIVDSTIDHNSTDADISGPGGGINVDSSESTLTLRGSEVAYNLAEGAGGGIFQDEGDLLVESSRIAHNESTSGHAGGGIAAEPDGSHTTKILTSTIETNLAGSEGGGIYADTGTGGLTVRDSTINENVGFPGGGIRTEGPALIESSTMTANSNGGLEARSDETEVRASTIVGNHSGNSVAGGLIAMNGFSDEIEITVRSSIVAGNTGAGGEPFDCTAEVASAGHNILGTLAGGQCTWPAAEGDQLGVAPQLGPLADNGGPTETMAPALPTSPAINRGGNPEPTDQRGETRPVPSGVEFTDVGAVEVQAPVNDVPPSIVHSGDLIEGSELTCEAGSWDTDSVAPDYSFTWLLDGGEQASGSSYELQASDAGRELSCEVVVDNGATTASATSEPVELQPGAFVLEPSSFDFGSRNLGAGPGGGQSFTLKNGGGTGVSVTGASSTDPTQFPVEASGCEAIVLAPGGSCTLEVSFAPTASGSQSATLSATGNVPTATAALSGTGTLAALAVSPSSHDFGSHRVGSGPSAAQLFEVTNTGTGATTIGQVAIGASGEVEFAIPADRDECSGVTLAPTESCSVEAVFEPNAAGPASAALAIPSEAPTATATLSGTGTMAAASVTPSSFDFGAQAIGAGPGAAKDFELTSAGSEPISLGEVTASGEFEVLAAADECSGETLEVGESCRVEVAFDPDSLGEGHGSLSVIADGPTESAELVGTGVSDPAFAAVPAELGFGSQALGTSVVRTVTIANTGGAPANVDSVEIAETEAAFSLPSGGDSCSGTELAPAATCTVDVAFSPSAIGAATATLEVAGDASTANVPLGGSGVAKPGPPAPAPASASLLDGGAPTANASGAVPLQVACASPGGAACEVTLTLQAVGSSLGAWSGRIAAGADQIAAVPLSAGARKQLGAKGRLAAEAVLSVAGGIGSSTPLTLRAPSPPILKLKSAQRVGDSILFKLSCGGYAARCKGKLALSKGATRLAGGELSLAKGGGEKVLGLTAAGKRLLEDGARPRLLAKLSVKDPVYQRTTTVKTALRLS